MKASLLFIILLIFSIQAPANGQADPASDIPAENAPVVNSDLLQRNINSYIDANCDWGINLPDSLSSTITNLVQPCDIKIEAVLGIVDADQKLLSFEREVCPCIDTQRDSLNLDSEAIRSLAPNAPRGLRQSIGGRSHVSSDAINDNIRMQNILLNEQRNGVMIQASILSANPNERNALTRAYSGRSAFENMIAAAAKNLTDATSKRGRTGVTATFAAPQVDLNLLQSDSNQCPSMRDFRHFRQFPPEDAFYADLVHERNNTYVANDWNFEKLRDRLKDLSTRPNNRILTLQSAKANAETGWIIRRMDFLMRNPLLKNFFQQDILQRGERTQLFDLVQRTFKPFPVSGPTSCLSKPGVCQGQAGTKANIYQNGLRNFFRRESIIEQVVEQDVDDMESTLKGLPRRVLTTPVIPDASDLGFLSPAWDQLLSQPVQYEVPVTDFSRVSTPSDTVFQTDGILNPVAAAAPFPGSVVPRLSQTHYRAVRLGRINNTCNMLSDRNNTAGEHGLVFAQLERQWAQDLCDPSVINSEFPCSNSDYFILKGQLCNRRNGQESISYDNWKQSGGCRDSGRNCVSQFIESTQPQSTESEQIAANWISVHDGAKISAMSETDSSTVSETVSRNNNLSEREFVRSSGANIAREFSAPVAEASIDQSRSTAITPRASPQSSSTSPQTADVNIQQVSSANVSGASGVSSAAPIITPTETLRTQVRQSETDAQGIREQISTLRETLQRENSAPASQESSVINSLSERLASLESRLETKEQETRNLRRQLARAESQPAQPARNAVGGAGADEDNSVGRVVSSPGSQVQAVAQNTNNASVAPASTNSPQTSPSASLQRSGAALSAPTASTQVRGGGNSALLSKYGVQSTTSQGAITVANPSSTIDYQALRTQSAESFLPLSLSQEEFNQLAGNNQGALDRYLDQVRAMPGEVVRLAITTQGTDSVMEIFVLKNGNQISIVPSNGATRSIASETPVPATAPARDKTLEELRQELSR